MKALQVKSPGKASVVDDAKVPSLRPEYILVKTVAVALNPSDWKHISILDKPVTVGFDFAGIIEEVGSEVTKPFKKGDRVAGFSRGSNVLHFEDGAFGEFLIAKGDLQIKLPDEMSFEEGSTLGVAVTTVGQGLYQSLKLPFPDNPTADKFPLLIYGGSTATGAIAIQYAKLSGLEVITTCSPRNFNLMKSFGADAVFDYSSPTCGADIRKYTNNKLFYVFDCIAEKNSLQICCDALSTSTSPSGMKPQYSALLPAEIPRTDVDFRFTMAYTVLGEPYDFRGTIAEAKPEDYEFGKSFIEVTNKLLDDKKIRVHRFDVRPGGLDGIMDGLDDMREGRVSGTKLVYRISDGRK